jgi:hypothetical protein
MQLVLQGQRVQRICSVDAVLSVWVHVCCLRCSQPSPVYSNLMTLLCFSASAMIDNLRGCASSHKQQAMPATHHPCSLQVHTHMLLLQYKTLTGIAASNSKSLTATASLYVWPSPLQVRTHTWLPQYNDLLLAQHQRISNRSAASFRLPACGACRCARTRGCRSTTAPPAR